MGLITAVAACDPTPGAVTGTGGGRGTAGGDGASPTLVGNWRNVLQTGTADGEVIVVETQWVFETAGDCSRTYYQTFVARGEQYRETTACTYTVAGNRLTVYYEGLSVPAEFGYDFDGDDLLIDGYRFVRF